MYCLEKLQRELAYFFDMDLRELPRVQDLLAAKGYTQVQKGDEIITLEPSVKVESTLSAKTTSKLTKEQLEALPLATPQEYGEFLEKIAQKDYQNTPEILKIATLNNDLQELINNSHSASVFITRARAGHISEARKGEYGQALTLDEQKQIPAVIAQAKEAYTDDKGGFILPFTDKNNGEKINLIILDSDNKGNFLITAKKVDSVELNNPKYKKLARAGVEPATTTPPNVEQKPTEAISPARNDIIPQESSDITFTDKNGKEHTLTQEVQEQWLKTFNLKSLDESYTPKHSDEILQALGGKEIKLQLGSLKKLVAQGREQYIPQIKEVLDSPEAILKDSDNAFLFARHLKDDDYFVNVSVDKGEYLVSISNGIKETSNIKNKLDSGAEVVYQSPNANSNLQTLLQASRYSANKIDSDIIPQNPSDKIDNKPTYTFIKQTLDFSDGTPKVRNENFTQINIEPTTAKPQPTAPRDTEDKLEPTSYTAKSLFDYTYEPKIKETPDTITIETIENDIKTTKTIDKHTGKATEQDEIIPAPRPKKRADQAHTTTEQDLFNLDQAIKNHWLQMVKDETPPKAPTPTPQTAKTPTQEPTKPKAPQPPQAQKLKEALQIPLNDENGFSFIGFGKVGSDTEILEQKLLPQAKVQHRKGTGEAKLKVAARSTLKKSRESLEQSLGIKPIADFGQNYPEFYRDGKGAIEKLLIEKQGQVAGAFYREELGEIDLVWGDSSYGLKHILDKHGSEFKDMPKELDEIIQNGEVVKDSSDRATLKYTTPSGEIFKVGLKGNWKGEATQNKWIITAYKDEREMAKTIDSSDFTKGETLPLNSSEIIPQTPPKATTPSPEPAQAPTPSVKFTDYHLAQPRDEIKDPATRLENNLEALRVIKELDSHPRPATDKEQEILANFSGFGGLTNAFKEGSESFKRLQELVSADDLAKLRQTILDAYYTPEKYIKLMYKSLEKFLPKQANVLEPSMGSGRFLTLGSANYKYTGIDLDTTTYKIAQALHPNQNLANGDYLKTPFTPNQFDLVVGNPPYGETKVAYKDMNGLNLHSAFMMKNIDLAKENGIIAQVVSASFLDSPTAQSYKARIEMVKKAKVAGVLRLPSDSFSGTSLATDMIILQKREKPLSQEQIDQREALSVAERALIEPPSQSHGVYENNAFISMQPNIRILADGKEVETGNYGAKRFRYNAYEDKAHEQEVIESWQDFLAQNLVEVKPSTQAIESIKDLQKLQEQSDFKLRDIGKVSFDGTNILQAEVKILGDGTKIIEHKKKDLDEFVLTKLDENKKGETIIDESELLKYRDLIKRKDSLKGAEKAALTRANKKLEMAKVFFTTYGDLRNAQVSLRKAELDPNITDKELESMRKNLNDLYDQTIENLKPYTSTPHLIQNSVLRNVFRKDIGFNELQALEKAKFDDNGNLIGIEKSDIFFRRLSNPSFTPTTASSIEQAMQYSMQYKARLDYEYMASILGKNAHDLRQELIAKDKIFIINASGQEGIRDELLAGNLRTKLKELQEAAEKGLFDESLLQNSIDIITKELPETRTFDQIKWDISSSFIPHEVWNLWKQHGAITSNTHILQNNYGRWYAKGFGYNYAPSLKKSREVTDADVFNVASGFTKKSFKDADDALRFDMAVQKMTKDFESFILSNEQAIKLIEQNYNETINIYAKSSYGSDMIAQKGFKFPNANPDIQLRPTQIRATFRAVYDPLNTLFNHEVGAGKTFTLITSAMELKRTGRAKKPMIVVPQHLVPQFTNEFYQLYPGAKLLSLQSIAQKDFKIAQSQIAYNEFDCIIVSHKVLDNMEMPLSYQLDFYKDLLHSRTQTAKNIETQQGKGVNLRKAEQEVKDIKKKIDDLKKAAKDSKNIALDFNELGIDSLLIDEAHEYKNLAFNSSFNFKGMGNSSGSDKAISLLMKTQYLNDNGKKLVFATGTPMANSLLEIHHMLKYLHPQGLKDLKIEHIDNFITNFVKTDKILESKAGGSKEFVETIVGVNNNQELMNLVNKVFDTIDFEQVEREAREAGIEITRPNQKNSNIVIEKYDEIKDIYDNIIIPEAKLLKENRQQAIAQSINDLTIFTKAKKLSVDPRLVDPSLIEVFKTDIKKREKTKIFQCAKNILKKDQEWSDRVATQIVFCDLMQADKDVADFHAHRQLKEYLLQDINALGGNFTKEQIVCIDEIDKKNYAKLYSAINRGEVKVLITTTAKTGTGANLQQKLVAMHHLDAPYRPSDFIQRIGRMIRQGNEYAIKWANALKSGEKAREFYAENLFYIVEDTLDSRLFEILENKARAFGDFFKGADIDLEVDVKAMVDYGILKAEASGNKNELEFYKVQNELKNLNSRKQINLEEFMNKGKKIQELEAKKNLLEAELEMIQVFKQSADSSDVEFMGKTYSFDFSKSQDKPNTLAFDDDKLKNDLQNLRDIMNKNKKEILEPMLTGKQNFLHLYSYGGADLVVVKDNITDEVGFCFEKDGKRLFIDARRQLASFSPSDTLNFIKTLHTKAKSAGAINKELVENRVMIKRTQELSAEFAEQDKIDALESYLNTLADAIAKNHKDPIEKPAEVAKFFSLGGAIGLGLYTTLYTQDGDFYEYKL